MTEEGYKMRNLPNTRVQFLCLADETKTRPSPVQQHRTHWPPRNKEGCFSTSIISTSSLTSIQAHSFSTILFECTEKQLFHFSS